MQKGFTPLIILIGIVVIIGIVGGAYYLGTIKNSSQSQVATSLTTLSPSIQPIQTTPSPTSTVDETANWKTYTNSVGGYTFKYPQDWVYSESELITYLAPTGQKLPKANTSDYASISVDVRKVRIPEHSKDQLDNYTEKEIVINGVTGQEISGTFKINNMYSGLALTEVVLANKGMIYNLIYYDEKGNFKTVFDKILSTFKFTQ